MKNVNYIIILTASIVLGGCKKFVEIDPPSNKVVASTVFTTDAMAIATINGLYAKMFSTMNSFASGGSTLYLGLYADELKTTGVVANVLEFQNSALSITNSVVNTGFWKNTYEIIYISNSILAGLENAAINPDLRNQLMGEAYFVRAFCYWNLVNLFGDVPLVLTVNDYEETRQMKRTSAFEVKAKVVSDLGEARKLLKPTYPSAGRFRPNYYTVAAMLSRVHTYLQNWNEVLTYSDEIISQNIYQIETDLNKVFLIGSNEAIWQTSTDLTQYNSTEGYIFVPTTSATTIPPYIVQPILINSFSSTDKRKTNWLTNKIVSGVIYTYPSKYKIKLSLTKTECLMMFRLAEVYLNRAEAKAHLSDATALDDLNKIRNRAGLSNLSGLSGTQLINAILQERRQELFAEWGLRWLDLKRTGQLNTIIGTLKPAWTINAALFPIPNAEILVAPNLIQNPGYN